MIEMDELTEEEMEMIAGGLSYHKGNQVTRYNIHKGQFYYALDPDTNTYELVLAKSNNREDYYCGFLFIEQSITVADVLWVTGKHKGKTEKYHIDDPVYTAEQD